VWSYKTLTWPPVPCKQDRHFWRDMKKLYILKQFKSFRLIASESPLIRTKGPIYFAHIERNIPDGLGNDSWQYEKCDFDLIQQLGEPYFNKED
jgi:hypothetical protein